MSTCPTVEAVFDLEIELTKVDLSHLDADKQQKLVALLRKHKAVFNDRPSCSNVLEASLPTKPGFEFKVQKPYRIPDKVKPQILDQVKHLLAEGRIAPAISEFVHPVVAVAKQGGGIRLAIDYRLLNQGLVFDSYPMPRADDTLREIAPAKILSACDCSQSFWSIPIRKEDQYKTAFVVDGTQYIWQYLPFGLSTSSQLWQKTVDIV